MNKQQAFAIFFTATVSGVAVLSCQSSSTNYFESTQSDIDKSTQPLSIPTHELEGREEPRPVNEDTSHERATWEHPLVRVASIVEFTVSRVWKTHDERSGPRTNYGMSDIIVHAGLPPDQARFSFMGGTLPNGNEVRVSDLPEIYEGSRYLAMFSIYQSFISPIWMDLMFQIHDNRGIPVVTTTHGYPVTGISLQGISLGSKPVYEPDSNSDIVDLRAPKVFNEDVLSEGIRLSDLVTKSIVIGQHIDAPFGAKYSVSEPTSGTWNSVPTSASGEDR